MNHNLANSHANDDPEICYKHDTRCQCLGIKTIGGSSNIQIVPLRDGYQVPELIQDIQEPSLVVPSLGYLQNH